jgi:hypothetical protein
MLYQIVVYLHVVFVFGYLLTHGASVAMAFALKRERNMEKIKNLLELSGNSYPMMFRTLYASVILGVIAGFQGHWWGRGWIWASFVLLIVIYVLMVVFGGIVYGSARKAAGLPYSIRGKPFPAEPAQSDEEVYALLAKGNPVLLTVIGYGGYALVAWLMIAKPF